jgi:hypothetical protein
MGPARNRPEIAYRRSRTRRSGSRAFRHEPLIDLHDEWQGMHPARPQELPPALVGPWSREVCLEFDRTARGTLSDGMGVNVLLTIVADDNQMSHRSHVGLEIDDGPIRRGPQAERHPRRVPGFRSVDVEHHLGHGGRRRHPPDGLGRRDRPARPEPARTPDPGVRPRPRSSRPGGPLMDRSGGA